MVKNGRPDFMPSASEKTIERLALYRRFLGYSIIDGRETIYSHEIAATIGSTAAQVRRDLMEVGCEGHPRHGYETRALVKQLDDYLGVSSGVRMVLVGVGNMGRAILAYFVAKKAHITVEAAFDTDPTKSGRTINGCHCYSLDELPKYLANNEIHVGIIAVPAGDAQRVADVMVRAGVHGILNLAPARLKVPSTVFVEDFDMTLSIEKVGFFSKQRASQKVSV